MKRTKILPVFLLSFLLLVSQVMVVAAQEVDPPVTENGSNLAGTVQEVVIQTDEATGDATVVVIVLDENGTPQSVSIPMETAVEFGLVTLDEEGNFAVNNEAVGQEIDMDPEETIDEPEPAEGTEHPVGSGLVKFFSDLVGVDYDTVMSYHEDGMGFGTMAQALWMTNKLGGDTDLFAAIVDAKMSGDFSAVTLPDGSTPKNWGQFKSAVMKDGEKSKENLGAVMRDKDNDLENDGLAPEESAAGLKPASKGLGNNDEAKTDKSNNAKDNNGKGKDKGKKK
ncbi:MAG: hypothetical protein JXA13_16245 [Anaerolineales bacterium]|nr:hypothetical protein [Anaerolineales bacterium]